MSMVVREFDPSSLVYNPAIAARTGDPDPEKVQMFAENFINRRDEGRPHQIQPGVVRLVTDKKGKELYEIIAGRHRCSGMIAANATLSKKDDPFMFTAVIVPSTDEQALVDAIMENEISVDSTIFDRAEAMNKLLDMGVKQVRIAKIFNVSEGTVSQTLAAGKLDRKFKAAVLNGDVESDAAILAAGLPVDDTKRNQIFEEAIRHRQRMDELQASIDLRKAKQAAESQIEEAKTKASEIKAKTKDLDSKIKDQAKGIAELEKLSAKTKDVAEIEALRKKTEEARQALKLQENEHKKMVKEQTKAEQLIEKAKAAKETVASAPKKSKATQEDVKNVASASGVKGAKPSKRSGKDLILFLEAWGNDKQDPMPNAGERLGGKIEGWLDGEYSDAELKKSFKANCLKDQS